jgi:hypothetical protein
MFPTFIYSLPVELLAEVFYLGTVDPEIPGSDYESEDAVCVQMICNMPLLIATFSL